ncbi:MAG: 23S rRNA (uracil(1939)-C(5))-methyltransferase RlmD [Burkholderiaceae bacterium]|nr:23S rRNA (uracil(1939)-C(5))-methyltransferase RlmD [Burkholderiaceae bacterium]
MSDVLEIESMDLEGRGIAHLNGKVVFVEGALPGETVLARHIASRKSFDKSRIERIIKPSSQRVEPPCPSFGICGGCAIQHLEPAAQVAIKQRVLEDALVHIGKVKAQQMLAPLHGPYWGYRSRARLSVRLVTKKGGALVGFRERGKPYVVDMHECLILPEHVSALLTPLRNLVTSLSIPARIPQIEVAVADQTTALALRHLDPLTDDDIAKLRDFALAHNVSWWLQLKGPETLHPLDPEDAAKLYYDLPEFGLRMQYGPSDFTQVNQPINQRLIVKALDLLDIQATDRVADLFCGLGNFTLPLATRAAAVVGIEGSQALTDRALQAAAEHGLDTRTQFATVNLFEVDAAWLRGQGYFDRMLIDPPREGAQALAQALSELEPQERPKRIVYVSCNPATLARDAGILVHQGGYRLASAGVINMFPHTAHVESIAVFESDVNT